MESQAIAASRAHSPDSSRAKRLGVDCRVISPRYDLAKNNSPPLPSALQARYRGFTPLPYHPSHPPAVLASSGGQGRPAGNPCSTLAPSSRPQRPSGGRSGNRQSLPHPKLMVALLASQKEPPWPSGQLPRNPTVISRPPSLATAPQLTMEQHSPR